MAYATFDNYQVNSTGEYFYATLGATSGNEQTINPFYDVGSVWVGTGPLTFNSTSVAGQVSVSVGMGESTVQNVYTLTQTGYQSADQITFHDASSGRLVLLSNVALNQNPDGSWPSATVSSDGSGGYFNGASVCFAEGTLIATAQGQRLVESLSPGDMVLTASGEEKAIAWTGHRSLRMAAHVDKRSVLPIRIAAHAFAENVPFSDLVVSPGHALAFDVLGDVLIPAKSLVNGATIQQVEVDTVTYYHLELEDHAVLLANGARAESFIDVGNRKFFSGDSLIDLHGVPDVMGVEGAAYCAPYHAEGPIVDAIRARMASRAEALGWVCTDDKFAGITLNVDGQILQPDLLNQTAKFVIPAGASSIEILSQAVVPAKVGANADERLLGVSIAAIRVLDGFSDAHHVALDDENLAEGFYQHEGDHRWTNGRAVLPASILADRQGSIILAIDLHCSIPQWKAPAPVESEALTEVAIAA